MVSSTHDQLYKFIFDDLELSAKPDHILDVYYYIFVYPL